MSTQADSLVLRHREAIQVQIWLSHSGQSKAIVAAEFSMKPESLVGLFGDLLEAVERWQLAPASFTVSSAPPSSKPQVSDE